jgi:hypothetical protein
MCEPLGKKASQNAMTVEGLLNQVLEFRSLCYGNIRDQRGVEIHCHLARQNAEITKRHPCLSRRDPAFRGHAAISAVIRFNSILMGIIATDRSIVPGSMEELGGLIRSGSERF